MRVSQEQFAKERYFRAADAVRHYEQMPRTAGSLPQDPVEFRQFFQRWDAARVEKDLAYEDWCRWRGKVPSRSRPVRL